MTSKSFASVEKVLNILGLYDLETPEFSAQEICTRLSMPLSSTHKYLDILLRRRLLSRNTATKKYRLGPMVFRLGQVFSKTFDFLDLAKPHLESLAEDSSETVLLTIVEGWEATCVDKVEPQRLIKFSLELGRRLPLHAGASSRILLAFQEEPFIEEYIRTQRLELLSDNTITEPDRLGFELARIREQGFAVSDSEVDSGAKAVSAPIFDAKGMLTAGLTIAGPSERMDEAKTVHLVSAAKRTAQEISRALGFLGKESRRDLVKAS